MIHSDEQTSKLYDRWIEFMVGTHGAFEEDPRNRFIFEEILAFSNSIQDDSTIIDIGAGQCELAMFFENSNYVGLDLGIGDENWDFSNISVRGDVQNLPLKDSVADAALNVWVMEHIPDPPLVMHEMFRVLKPGGKVFLVAPFSLHEHQQPFDFYRYTRFGIKHLFESSGFSSIRVYYDSSQEFAMGHESYKWLLALSERLTMQEEQREQLNKALEITRALMLATAEQFPAKTGDFALNWICIAEK